MSVGFWDRLQTVENNETEWSVGRMDDRPKDQEKSVEYSQLREAWKPVRMASFCKIRSGLSVFLPYRQRTLFKVQGRGLSDAG